MSNIIVIVGPTGVGKTKLSIELAKKLNGEIINADSTQVYKELDIATAKVKDEEKQGIPHHLFDIKNIAEDYTVYAYQADGRRVLNDILKRGKTAIIVGGTGLYIKALLYDYQFKEETTNLELENLSDEELYSKLLLVDPNTEIHKNNHRRIIRALNYYNENKEPISSKPKAKPIYNFKTIGLTTNRNDLYEIINKRVDKMLGDGLIKEAKYLYSKNRTKSIMTPIGYKELFEFFDNHTTLEQSIELIKKRSRNYAKRQYTWFNNQMDVTWFEVDFIDFNKTVDNVLNYLSDEN